MLRPTTAPAAVPGISSLVPSPKCSYPPDLEIVVIFTFNDGGGGVFNFSPAFRTLFILRTAAPPSALATPRYTGRLYCRRRPDKPAEISSKFHTLRQRMCNAKPNTCVWCYFFFAQKTLLSFLVKMLRFFFFFYTQFSYYSDSQR